MSYETPTVCPICQSDLRIKIVECDKCGTSIKGDLKLGAFAALTKEHRQFIIDLLKRGGNTGAMEKEFRASDADGRAKMNEILAALGEEPAAAREGGTAVGDAKTASGGKEESDGRTASGGRTPGDAKAEDCGKAANEGKAAADAVCPKEPEASRETPKPLTKRAVLEALSSGKIDTATAQRMIKEL